MGTVEKLQLLTKEDLLHLQIDEEIMIGYHNDPLTDSLRIDDKVYRVIARQWWLNQPKIKLKFEYDSIDYRTSKPIIRRWNMTINDSINIEGEQKLYSDSEKGRTGTRVFFKLNKQ